MYSNSDIHILSLFAINFVDFSVAFSMQTFPLYCDSRSSFFLFAPVL